MIGNTIGPYQVIGKLGEGGMGEVYRARDPRLNRDVAIKVLPASVAGDPDRLARFSREAQVLASLNHPHIAHVYGVEESVGVRGLVMELVEGDTLADRIAQGPVAVADTLPVARQIADALDAAHERGIVHRDLKPANIKIGSNGTVKILDFGLAKALDPADVGARHASRLPESPTITTPAMTAAGIILGTAAYMSPEQARGKPVDKRADIWAFGVVLYEMLTGKQLFASDTVSDTIAEVLKREIDLQALPADTPRQVRDLIGRCLQRDPKLRLRDIGDARRDLDQSKPPELAVARRPSGAPVREIAAWAIAVAAVIATAALWFRPAPAPAARAEAVQFGVPPPHGFSFARQSGAAPYPSLSPDGRRLVFATADGGPVNFLWLRELDSQLARALPDTAGAEQPFWSPDSSQLAFFQQGSLKVLNLDTGISRVLCAAYNTRRGSWNSTGTILFAQRDQPIMMISASGGTPVAVTKAEVATVQHQYPSFLPDGRRFLFTVFSSVVGQSEIMVGSLDSPVVAPVVKSLSQAQYADPGYVIYVVDGVLLAQAVDPKTIAPLSSPPISLAQNVSFTANSGIAAVDATAGALTYFTVPIIESDIVERDRRGARVRALADKAVQNDVQLSPDGQVIAVYRANGANQNIWFIDVARNLATRFSTATGVERLPRWSPDSKVLGFSSTGDAVGNNFSFVTKERTTTAPARLVLADHFAFGWTTDPLVALCRKSGSLSSHLIVKCPVAGATITPVTEIKMNASTFVVSPDGEWLLFVSNLSGQDQVYIRRLQGESPNYLVSRSSGNQPRWRRDMKEVFYVDGNRLVAVPVSIAAEPTIGEPSVLFEVPALRPRNFVGDLQFDTLDGQRFYVNEQRGYVENPITVTLNWTALLPRTNHSQ